MTKQLKPSSTAISVKKPSTPVQGSSSISPLPPSPYKVGDAVATREAFGNALERLGEVNPLVVGLDADVKNSTYTDKFGKKFPNRFFENFIAEQNMVGVAAGLAACGKVPFAATFACFLARAYDFIRMAAISGSNIKLVGTHVGVSIGEDGPSQMGLEDIAMMAAQPGVTVLYPSDATCTYRLVETAATHKGMVYIRAGRPKSPVLYGPDETFQIGGSKVIRQSGSDVLTIVAAGVTLFEALKAYDILRAAGVSVRIVDLYSIVPIDRTTLLDSARATQGRILTVEDHYAHGGLGTLCSARSDPKASRCISSLFARSRTAGSRTNLSTTLASEHDRLSKQPNKSRNKPFRSALAHELDVIPLLNILSGPARQRMLQELIKAQYGKGDFILGRISGRENTDSMAWAA